MVEKPGSIKDSSSSVLLNHNLTGELFAKCTFHTNQLMLLSS